jgi:K+-sensing histidine kinase KdpD
VNTSACPLKKIPRRCSIGSITLSIRLQARIASHRERRTATLYAMSRELSATRGKENILRAAVKHLHEVFDSLLEHRLEWSRRQ